MTRFIISNQEVVTAVEFALEHHLGGEIFVPKTPSYRITDLATAIAPNMGQEEVGIRPGEKIYEELHFKSRKWEYNRNGWLLRYPTFPNIYWSSSIR